MARCPAHDDREPSLSVRDGRQGKVLVHCHAGCAQAEVIAALKSCGFGERSDRKRPRETHRGSQTVRDIADLDDARRTEAALAIWRAAGPADGSLVETYLASRGLHMPLPPALRLHAGLKHPSGGIGPAMIALVTRGTDGMPVAVHRTFLARDGRGKAPVKPERMMLGPCRGGAVRLGVARGLVMVGEGIETCLAAMQATGNPAWAALSTSGLHALELPGDLHDVIVLADADPPGEAAARAAATRWRAGGRRVRIARPSRGKDFNDSLLPGAPRIEEGAR
jgi:hypothetical protein